MMNLTISQLHFFTVTNIYCIHIYQSRNDKYYPYHPQMSSTVAHSQQYYQHHWTIHGPNKSKFHVSQTAIAISKIDLDIDHLDIFINIVNLFKQVESKENPKFKILGNTGPDVTTICQSIPSQYSLVRTVNLCVKLGRTTWVVIWIKWMIEN